MAGFGMRLSSVAFKGCGLRSSKGKGKGKGKDKGKGLQIVHETKGEPKARKPVNLRYIFFFLFINLIFFPFKTAGMLVGLVLL